MYNICSLTLDIYNQMYFSISVLHACGCHLKCWRNQLSFDWHWGWSHYHRLRFKLCALCFIELFAETSKVDIRLVWITNYTNNVIHWSIDINFIFYHVFVRMKPQSDLEAHQPFYFWQVRGITVYDIIYSLWQQITVILDYVILDHLKVFFVAK